MCQSLGNSNQNLGNCFRHDYSAPSFRNGSTSRQRGPFSRASSDQNGHIMEAHRPGYVGYSAAASRQPSSFRQSQVVAYAEFQRPVAAERIRQLPTAIEKRSGHHWRIFRKSEEFEQHERRFVVQPTDERRPVEATLPPQLRLVHATRFGIQKSVRIHLIWRIEFSSVRSRNASASGTTSAATSAYERSSFQLTSAPASQQQPAPPESASVSAGVFPPPGRRIGRRERK